MSWKMAKLAESEEKNRRHIKKVRNKDGKSTRFYFIPDMVR